MTQLQIAISRSADDDDLTVVVLLPGGGSLILPVDQVVLRDIRDGDEVTVWK